MFARQTRLESAERKSVSSRNSAGRRVTPGALPSGALLQRKPACACGGGCPACQAKSNDLRVSQPNDSAEIEADQIADQVMRMPAGGGKALSTGSNASNGIHRKCAACEKEEEESIQRKPLSSAQGIPSGSPDHVRSVIGSGGQPLDLQTRSFFESRFGIDLSLVRVHTGPAAEQSAGEVNAHAYAIGPNIVFGEDQYAPDTATGRQLLAHELTHVVQQGAAGMKAAACSADGGATMLQCVLPNRETAVPRFNATLSSNRRKTRTIRLMTCRSKLNATSYVHSFASSVRVSMCRHPRRCGWKPRVEPATTSSVRWFRPIRDVVACACSRPPGRGAGPSSFPRTKARTLTRAITLLSSIRAVRPSSPCTGPIAAVRVSG